MKWCMIVPIVSRNEIPRRRICSCIYCKLVNGSCTNVMNIQLFFVVLDCSSGAHVLPIIRYL